MMDTLDLGRPQRRNMESASILSWCTIFQVEDSRTPLFGSQQAEAKQHALGTGRLQPVAGQRPKGFHGLWFLVGHCLEESFRELEDGKQANRAFKDLGTLTKCKLRRWLNRNQRRFATCKGTAKKPQH